MYLSERSYREGKQMLEGWRERLEEQKQEWIAEGYQGEELENLALAASYWSLKIQADVEEYEAIRRGEFDHTCTFDNIGKQLIRFRIWKGLSQSQLAERLGVSPQQVHKDERNEYYRASSEKIRQVLEALGIEVQIVTNLKKVSNE